MSRQYDEMDFVKQQVKEEKAAVLARQQAASETDGTNVREPQSAVRPTTSHRSTEDPIAPIMPPSRPQHRRTSQEKAKQYESPAVTPKSVPKRRNDEMSNPAETPPSSLRKMGKPGVDSSWSRPSSLKKSPGRYRDKMAKFGDASGRRSSNGLDPPPQDAHHAVHNDGYDATPEFLQGEALPGAVSMSVETGARHLEKGRLTRHHSTSVRERDSFASSLEAGNNNQRYDQGGSYVEAEVAHSSRISGAQDETKKTTRWYCETRYKIMMALLLVAAVAVGVAVPLAASGGGGGGGESSDPTSAPTSAPDFEERRNLVLSQVSLVSDADLLDQENTPQNLALEWIVTQDLLSPLDETPSQTQVDKLLQRYALVVFFYATQGETSWIVTRNWLNGQVNECDWILVVCNDQGKVTSLDSGPAGNGITGELPGEIGVLGFLESIKFQRNKVSRLPEELVNLPNLVHLDLDDNALVGSIPDLIYDLTSLDTLILAQMSLTGTISSSISNLSQLTFLDLFLNELNGTYPLESLLNLRILTLSSNKIQGNITELIIRQPELEEIGVASNSFGGNLPTEIGVMPNLRTLHLDSNPMSSTIPSEIGLVTTLEFVGMSATSITGTIPSEIANLTNLLVLILSTNRLSSPVPPEICGLRPPEGVLGSYQVDCDVGCTCCTNFCVR